MATDINTILSWFKTGLKPTQAQFWASWQSFWHKDEQIPQSSIANLEMVLNAKAEKDQFDIHKTDVNAHSNQFNLKEDKANKGVANGYVPLDSIMKIAYNYLDIVNDLVTGGKDSILAAEQGKILQQQIDVINVLIGSDDVNLDTVQEIVDAIKQVGISLEMILVNDLTTGGVTKALTAEMGKLLSKLKENTENKSNSIADISSTEKFPTWKVVSDWALGLFKNKFLQFVDVASVAYTFGTSANNTRFNFTSNTSITAIIPSNTEQPFEIGTVFETIPLGNGILTVNGDVGVTIVSNLSNVSVKNEVRRYTKIDANTWTVEGNSTNKIPSFQELAYGANGTVVFGGFDLRLGLSGIYSYLHSQFLRFVYTGSGDYTIEYGINGISLTKKGGADSLNMRLPSSYSGISAMSIYMPIAVNDINADSSGKINLSTASGSFLSADGKTITVVKGIITSIA